VATPPNAIVYTTIPKMPRVGIAITVPVVILIVPG